MTYRGGTPKDEKPDGEDLTDEQRLAMEYIGDAQNLITADGRCEQWKSNVMENRPFFSKGNPDLPGLTTYLVCAGPSLEKNVGELREISERGIILSVDAAMGFLMKNGIVPEFCMSIDGSEKIADMVRDCDTSQTTLVCTPTIHPAVVRGWKGPIFFVTTYGPGPIEEKRQNHYHLTRIVKAVKELKPGDEMVVDEHYKVEFKGLDTRINCGGNVSTCAHHFALQYLKSQQVVFVGQDLSWKYSDHHYAGSEHRDHGVKQSQNQGGEHIDVNNEKVLTNLSFLGFKRWHEAMGRNFYGSLVNATEGGILGVKQAGDKMNFVEFLTLKEAVAKYTPKRRLSACEVVAP